MTSDGLVGSVTQVTGSSALVTLLTDESSAVQARDRDTDAFGIVQHGQGEGSLIVDGVTKDKQVKEGDVIVTAGTAVEAVPVALPARHPDRHRHQRRPERHGAVQTDSDPAVRRLLVARRGHRSDHEEAESESAVTPADAAKTAVLLFFTVVVQLSIMAQVTILGGHPNLLLVTLCCVALLRGALVGAIAGFSAGLARRYGRVRDAGLHRAAAHARRLLDGTLRRDDGTRPGARTAGFDRGDHDPVPGLRRSSFASCSARTHRAESSSPASCRR